jgi:hypothetical protein
MSLWRSDFSVGTGIGIQEKIAVIDNSRNVLPAAERMDSFR